MCNCNRGILFKWGCGYTSSFFNDLCPLHGGCLQGLEVVRCGCPITPKYLPDIYLCRRCCKYSRFDYTIEGVLHKKCHTCGYTFDPAKEWLGNLGEDREWFISWVCFGSRPTYDPQQTLRYDTCVARLSIRQQEECRVIAVGNTWDVILGRNYATQYIKEGMERIRRQYEDGEADNPFIVET